MELKLDLDALTVGQIDLIEEKLTEKLGQMITFTDVVATLTGEGTPRVPVPLGKSLRVIAMVTTGMSWEDTANVTLPAEDAATTDPTGPPSDVHV